MPDSPEPAGADDVRRFVSEERRSLLKRIRTILVEASVEFHEEHHPPVHTAAEAARIRGTPLSLGVKAIVFKTDDQFRLFAMAADRSLRSRRIRKELGVKRTRFATEKELRTIHPDLMPGAVPPFGVPVLPLELMVDPSLLKNDSMVFTAGVRTTSIFLAVDDYLRVARPTVVRFAE